MAMLEPVGPPAGTPYIVQRSVGKPANSQALDALATGLMKVATGTGVVSTAVGGVDYLRGSDLVAGANIAITVDPATGEMTIAATSPATANAVTSVAGRTGAITLAVADVAGLGSAATHAATDFLAPNGDGSGLANLNASSLASGTLSAARLPTTTVVAGSYTLASVTVDAAGRITAAASGAASGGGSATTSAGSAGQVQLAGANGTFAASADLTLDVANRKAGLPGGAIAYYWGAGGGCSWIDLPTTGPSGIGTGGPGVNPFLAYVASTGQFFSDASPGDVVVRNSNGAIKFGATGGVSQFYINSSMIGFHNQAGNTTIIIAADTGLFAPGVCSDGGRPNAFWPSTMVWNRDKKILMLWDQDSNKWRDCMGNLV